MSADAQVPTIGRIVLYTLHEQDADAINRRREHARTHLDDHHANANGVQIHVGNRADEGDVFPMVITRVWGVSPTSAVNGQVLLDGNDLYWVTSVSVGSGPHTFSWPARS